MQYLNDFNAFGSVRITPDALGVIIYTFSIDGFMHKVANRFKLAPVLPVRIRLVMPFAAVLISGREPKFILSLDRTPAQAQALVDEAQIIRSMYDVAYELMERLGFTLPDGRVP